MGTEREYSVDQTLPLRERAMFARALGSAVRFFPLDSQGKNPLVKLKGREHRLTPPNNPQYGVLLPEGLFAVDVDTHSKEEIGPQIQALNYLLKVDLTKTLTVKTASGGRHFYLRIPSGIPLDEMPNGSLRYLEDTLRLDKEFAKILNGRQLDTDLKVGKPGKISYTVGAGSYSARGMYSWTNLPILDLPREGAWALIQARAEHKERQAAKVRSRRVSTETVRVQKQTRSCDVDPSESKDSRLSPGQVNLVLRSLNKYLERIRSTSNTRITFHSQRAHIFHLLKCCFNDATIANACVSLKVNRDHYSESEISWSDLLEDIARLRESNDSREAFHGTVCGKGRFKADLSTLNKTFEQTLEELDERVESRSLARRGARISANARAKVVDMTSVREAIDRTARATSAKNRHALAIVRTLVQPILNAGGDRIVMGRDFITTTLGLTSSQTAKALHVLRESEVLFIKDRQKTGLASTYSLNAKFVDSEMSESLSLERQFRQLGKDVFPALVIDYETKTIIESHTGEVIAGNGEVESAAIVVSKAYSVDEAKRREEIAQGDYSLEQWREDLNTVEATVGDLESVDLERDIYSNPERLSELEELGVLHKLEELLKAPVSNSRKHRSIQVCSPHGKTETYSWVAEQSAPYGLHFDAHLEYDYLAMAPPALAIDSG